MSKQNQGQQRRKCEDLMDYALKLLSKRRLTSHEIELRLRKKGVGKDDDILNILAGLKELSYLDDHAYARDFISDRLKFRPRGVFAIKRDMYEKGLPKEVIERAVIDAQIDEEAVARDVMERRLNSLERYSLFQKKQKLLLFLRSRGFRADIIYKIVDEIKK